MSIIPQSKKNCHFGKFCIRTTFPNNRIFFLFKMLSKEDSIFPLRTFAFFIEMSTDGFYFVFCIQTLMALYIIIHSESEKYKLESCLEPLSNCFVQFLPFNVYAVTSILVGIKIPLITYYLYYSLTHCCNIYSTAKFSLLPSPWAYL